MQRILISIFLLSCVISCGGKDGKNALQPLTNLSAANESQCGSGGIVITSGNDVNGNGLLDSDEITGTQVVCNGKDGTGLSSLVSAADEAEGDKLDLRGDFAGSLELSAPAPFHSLTLRSIANAAGDFALTPYPLETSSSGPLYFAHLTADGSYSSDILLWNSQAQPVAARLAFFAPDGKPAAPAGLDPEIHVQMLSGQLRRVTLPRATSAFFGYARVTRTSGPSLPAMTAVITRWESGAPASEAGIPATPLLTDDLIVLAERPNQHTGLALLNPGPAPAAVELEILESDAVAGKTTVSLASGEKRAFFLFEVFDNLPAFMTGTLRIRGSGGVAGLALAGITNERGNFLMASFRSNGSACGRLLV